MKQIERQCCVCDADMSLYLGDIYRCDVCGYMSSFYSPGPGAEVEGVDAVREKNFRQICHILLEKFPKCKTILDVGASRGTFVRIAVDYGFLVTALEPDLALVDAMKQKGFEVIDGFFPGAIELTDKKFDVIIFNDSFEHIPNLLLVIDGVKKHLTPDGVAVVNLPSSDGFLFRCSLILAKVGMMAPWYRLWQKDMASPHLHYLNPRNLKRLFELHNFKQEYSRSLSYYVLSGLWKRISCASSLLVAIPSWIILVTLYPLFCLKSDAVASFFSCNKN
ncbi:hypothetical protein AGMMS50276_25210 [Synergistales bacterium]|nr:hypothetical protein AGMMS50276_25210 [Synergistales bacterium]